MNLLRHGRPIRFDTACLALLVQPGAGASGFLLEPVVSYYAFQFRKVLPKPNGTKQKYLLHGNRPQHRFFFCSLFFFKMPASQVKTLRTECTLISLATAWLTVTSCYSCLSSYYCFKGPPTGCKNIQGAERYRILLYKLKPFLLSVGSHLQSSSSKRCQHGSV